MATAAPNEGDSKAQCSAYLLNQLQDWALSNGLVMRPKKDQTTDVARVAPVTAYPTEIASELVENAVKLSETYNELYAAISMDQQWLGELVEEIADIDDFTRELWGIHRTIMEKGGYKHQFSLGIWRSDYLEHAASPDCSEGARPILKQVEFNTISSSFGALSDKVYELHRFLSATDAYGPEMRSHVSQERITQRRNIAGICGGLFAAHHAYVPSTPGVETAILFIVQEGETNTFDQRLLETYLVRELRVSVLRLSFNHVLMRTRLAPDSTLVYRSESASLEFEVSTIYYRAGYDPSEYTSKSIWLARLHLEGSRATKCPSVLGQIAGLKKVQQALATPGSRRLEDYLPERSEQEIAILRGTFMPMFPINRVTPEGRQGVSIATDVTQARDYVLKPQREGGGHNIYHENISDFLKGLPEDQWKQYILMKLIRPAQARNAIYREGILTDAEVINELGVFGVCLYDVQARQIVMNEAAGLLMRVKSVDADEGGVAAGFACVGSILAV